MSLDFGMVGVFLAEDPGCFFGFLAGVPLELSGHSHFRAIFKTNNTEINLLHVFSDGVLRDAKMMEEGGQGKGKSSDIGLHVDLKFSAAEKSAEEALVPDKGQ